MTTRRSFLGAVAGGTAAATAFHGLARAAGEPKVPLGLQLYSLRGMLAKDATATLKQVKAWGFDEVETFATFGAEIAPLLKAAGLKARAMHIGFDRLDKDLPGVLRDADALGATTVLNPSLPHKAFPATREEVLTAASAFSRWSKACRAAGKRFGYHLHGHEFGPAAEGTLFDVLATESGPDVGFEFDVYWIAYGGGDPVALMKKHAGRVWFTHLKDMATGLAPGAPAARDEASKVVLGTGGLDVAGIVAAGPAAGVEMHFIEDESADPVGQIPKSIAYYQSL
ncbi:MAG TPA: sugar phosphate isomerase/epimerase [Vicinamibacteria bacterium]|nr:sugar phosphate isomerase/epimerase [Vicinamibacteria bacterium]